MGFKKWAFKDIASTFLNLDPVCIQEEHWKTAGTRTGNQD